MKAGFLSELGRRKVWQVAGTYLAGALTALLAVAELYAEFGLPDGTPRVVALVLAGGFPFTLLLAWFYDLRRDVGASPARTDLPAVPETRSDGTVGATRAVMEAVPDRPSVVVLPFDNFSPDDKDAFLADGLTEEITADLCLVKALRVISRTSATAAKARGADVVVIGRELGADYLLEGSVRKAGDRLRITAQLIRTSNDEHLWAEKYDGSMEDVFGMQESVSRRVVDALHLHLTPDEDRRIAEHPVRDLEAYECYLKAREALIRFTEDSSRRAIELLERALDLEGDSAVLYAGLGYAWSSLVNVGGAGDEGVRKSEAYSERALQLDPDLPQAHQSLGFLRIGMQGRPAEGLEHLERALEADPDDLHTLGWLVGGYTVRGRLLRMSRLLDRMTALDPADPMTRMARGADAWARGDPTTAAEVGRAWLQDDPDSEGGAFYVGFFSMLGGDEEAGTRFAETHFRWPPEGTFAGFVWLTVAAVREDRAMRDSILTPALREGLWRDCQFSYLTASILARGGWHEEAIGWLERAVSELQFTAYPFFDGNDPWIGRLEGDPRYEGLKAAVEPVWRREMEEDRRAERLVGGNSGMSTGAP